MKQRVATAILTAAALAAIATGTASARLHVTSFPTVFHVDYAAEPGGGVFSGELISIKRTCNPRREIVVTIATADGPRVVGRGKSNAEGRFEFAAGEMPSRDVSVEARVLEKRIPPRTRYVKRVCLQGKAQVLVN